MKITIRAERHYRPKGDKPEQVTHGEIEATLQEDMNGDITDVRIRTEEPDVFYLVDKDEFVRLLRAVVIALER